MSDYSNLFSNTEDQSGINNPEYGIDQVSTEDLPTTENTEMLASVSCSSRHYIYAYNNGDIIL